MEGTQPVMSAPWAWTLRSVIRDYFHVCHGARAWGAKKNGEQELNWATHSHLAKASVNVIDVHYQTRKGEHIRLKSHATMPFDLSESSVCGRGVRCACLRFVWVVDQRCTGAAVSKDQFAYPISSESREKRGYTRLLGENITCAL